MKLFDSEWKVMDELWENGDLSAKELSQRLNSCVGWNNQHRYGDDIGRISRFGIYRSRVRFACHADLQQQ